MLPYDPSRPPLESDDPQEARDWAERELQDVSNSLSTAHDLNVAGAAPSYPSEGMMRYADGAAWDPGYGAGPYVYMGGTWAPMWRDNAGLVEEGGTTLYKAAGGAGGGDITSVPIAITGYDQKAPNEVAAVGDTTLGSIQVNGVGFWVMGFNVAFGVVPSNADESREVSAEVYNLTTGTPILTFSNVVVPRYGESVALAGTLRFGVTPDDIGESLQIRTWSPSGHTIEVSEVQSLEFWVARVSNSSTYPGAPAPTKYVAPVRRGAR